MSSKQVEPENAIVSDSLDAMEIQLNESKKHKNLRKHTTFHVKHRNVYSKSSFPIGNYIE